MIRQLAVVVSISALVAPVASAAEAAGPMAQLKQQNEKIDRILKSKPPENSPAEKAAKEQLKTVVNNLLDYDELARRSLKQHWDKLTADQRKEFVSTLRELIEKNYVRQLRTHLDYQVVYKNESVAGKDATVSTIVKVKTKGRSTDTSIDYKMHDLGGAWKVFDVITDEVSMVKNYYTQFNKIITEKGFPELLARMRKKIAESDASASEGASK